MEEDDSKRTLNFHNQNVHSTLFNNNNKAVPQPQNPVETSTLSSFDISSSNSSYPVTGPLGIGTPKISFSQDSGDSGVGMDVAVLQPPAISSPSPVLSYSGGGKPLHLRRGPGRPRKKEEGAGRSSRPGSSQKMKKLTGAWPNDGTGRVRVRKKTEERAFVVGGTNNATLGELNLFSGSDSPPRLLTVMDDTAESDSSSVASSLDRIQEDLSLFPELWPGKHCALCNLGERSMLGQGDLVRVDLPPGFDPQAVAKQVMTSTSRIEKDSFGDRSPKGSTPGRRRPKLKKPMSQSSTDGVCDSPEEIIGFIVEPDLATVFNTTSGNYFVHSNCAFWCDNVKCENGVFVNLESEIVRASSQFCGYCGNFGAAISCKASGCGMSLHVPCAAASGAFQDITTRTTLCSLHTEHAVEMVGRAANCTVCDQPGSISFLLMCSSCNNHYHSACLALSSDPTIRAGWQCPACKTCQACRQPGEESKLLPCDACDKVYHLFCLRPPVTSLPKYSWKCKMCRICTDCGSRTPGSGPSSRWHANFSVCDSCYQQRNKGLACPICGKAYRHVSQKHMVQCHQCKRYVHDTCDPAAALTVYQAKKASNPDYEYVCNLCTSVPNGVMTGSQPRVLLSIKRSERDDFAAEINSAYNSFASSRDSFMSPEDDSLGTTEVSDIITVLDKTSYPEDYQRQVQHAGGRGKPLAVLQKRKFSGRPKSIDKSTAVGNKRQRLTDLQRKRGPKPRIRGAFGQTVLGLQRPCIDLTQKPDDEPGLENRLVLCSSRDEFVLQQDVCVMCGAFGNDLEGRLISCAQCGQCYHPYCVNVKVTKVILQKGWRCLDCTVCEGCGRRHDEARLILCDDCDVSFHIYCMDPPLDCVPQGTWKCKWCVVCQLCGKSTPGLDSSWHNNYTLCGPCYSENTCSSCNSEYLEGDLTIQCTRCEKWLHASCDRISNESEADKCAEENYKCMSCRPEGIPPPHLQPRRSSAAIKSSSHTTSDTRKTSQPAFLDGVALTELGGDLLKSLTLDPPKKKRKKTKNLAAMTEQEAGIMATIESVISGSDGHIHTSGFIGELSEKEQESLLKKQKHMQKLGIGGFMARARGPRHKDDDDTMDSLSYIEGEKPKRKPARKKKQNKLVESFPQYLQEAFFGSTSQFSSRETDFADMLDTDVTVEPKISEENIIQLTPDELTALSACKKERDVKPKVSITEKISDPVPALKTESTKQHLRHTIKIEEELDDNLDLPMHFFESDILNTLTNDGSGIKDSLDDIANSALGADGELNLDTNSGDGTGKDDLNFDFIENQFNLDTIESGLPSMDSKDVEDIFKGVLTDESQESQDNIFPINNVSHPGPPPLSAGQSIPSHLMSQQQLPSPMLPTPPLPVAAGVPNRTQLQQNVQQGLASPISFPPPSPYHSEYSNSSPQFSPAFSEPPSPWPNPGETEQETPSSYSQRNVLKWEADEALGLQATISAVLYANTNHPELKREFPAWAERAKQIAKIWRGLPTEKRAPFLQKARENRAANRMQKTQISREGKGTAGGQSPESECLIKTSPSSLSSCSASGSSDVINSISTESPNSVTNSVGATSFASSVSASNEINGAVRNAFQDSARSNKASTSSISAYSSIGNQTVKVGVVDNRCSSGDNQIRVLTPSEIMKTLPTLNQEHCGFSDFMDQDKGATVPGGKQPTQEDRQWKQMQVLRQQQQLSLQDKDLQGKGGPGKMQYSPGMSPTGRPQQPEILGMGEMGRQPLQVSTGEPMPTTQSPLLQSPRGFGPASNMGNRPRPANLGMPPPSPGGHFGARQPVGPQGARPMVFSRPQFMQSQRPPLSSPHDPYASSPMTPQSATDPYAMPPSTPRPLDDQFGGGVESYHKLLPDNFPGQSGNAGTEGENSNINSSRQQAQGQETRQHLRGLLERQQIKKFEQDHVSPELPSPGSNRSMQWNSEDWSKTQDQSVSQNYSPRLPTSGPNSPQLQQQNQFRHPFLPGQQRMNLPPQGMPRGDFRNVSQGNLQGMDPRARMMVPQQRMTSPNQQMSARGQLQFGMGPPQQMQQNMHSPQLQQQLNGQNQYRMGGPPRNPLDPYDHLVTGNRQTSGIDSGKPSSMLAQQLGRPLNSANLNGQPQIPMNSPPGGTAQAPAQTLSPSRAGAHTMSMTSSTEHHELPESVTAELEKLEQEQHNDAGVEAEANDFADMGIDDDELFLSFSSDFNILEYADPELDQAGEGDKNNILDNLDLEEDKDEEKEENKDSKRSGNHDKQSSSVGSIAENLPPNSHGISTSTPSHNAPIPPGQANFSQMGTTSSQPSGLPGTQSSMRPQPPPPYPGPPPPYPGRPQIGMHGGGVSLQSVSSVVSVGMGLSSPVGLADSMGLRQPNHQGLSQLLPSSCDPVMPQHHRRTLLLQEQPLLLEDLLEQEKREQQRRDPLTLGTSSEEPLLSDLDFERLKADVMGSANLPVSLSPPAASVCLPPPPQPGQFARPMQSQMSQPLQSNQWQAESGDPNIRRPVMSTEHQVSLHPALIQGNTSNMNIAQGRPLPNFHAQSVPAPPMPPEHPSNDQERQMQVEYEKWINHQHHVVSSQLKYYEEEVAKLRKTKKSLSSKQRQAKKNGNDLNENDASELERVVRELGGLQKHLDSARKQNRQHNSLMTDYQNKHQKRQQMANVGPGPQGPVGHMSQPSPMGGSHQSPMHSTPQSPILSPAPMGAPVSSPLMQHHSPMASPLAPSPGPTAALASPRGSMGPLTPHLEDRPFSPMTDVGMRPGGGPQGNLQGRMQPRMSMQIQQPGAPMMNQHQGNPMMGGNQRPMGGMQRGGYMDNQRMRSIPPDQLRMMNAPPRFQQRGMIPEMGMRPRGHPVQFQNMNAVPNQHFMGGNPQRVPFPNQSPTGPNSMNINMVPSLRSPLPVNHMGGLNSPPGSQTMMNQNRVSPASSPMRRPSGSGSIGVSSPIPDRPQSVENPLTPRGMGSAPHTPTGMQTICQPMGSDSGGPHFSVIDENMVPGHQQPGPVDYNNGGGGGSNPHILPYPTFSWFDQPFKLGLRGGNPFSVMNGAVPSSSSSVTPTQNEVTQGTIASEANHVDANSAITSGPGSSLVINAITDSSGTELRNCMEDPPQLHANSSLVSPGTVVSGVPALKSKQLESDSASRSSYDSQVDMKPDMMELNSNSQMSGVQVSSSQMSVPVHYNMTDPRTSTQTVTSLQASVPNSSLAPMTFSTTVSGEVPPSSAYQANVGVLGGYRPMQTQAGGNAIVSSGDTSSNYTMYNSSSVSGMSQPVVSSTSLTSFVADAVSTASLPIPTLQSSVSHGVQNPSVSLITVFSRPELKPATVNMQSINPTPMVLNAPRLSTSISNQQQLASKSAQSESQNALLKQLLQNTGCASKHQTPADNSSFSLSTFSKPRATPLQTSQLSEAASRIPQPNPAVSRPTSLATPAAPPFQVSIKTEPKLAEVTPVGLKGMPNSVVTVTTSTTLGQPIQTPIQSTPIRVVEAVTRKPEAPPVTLDSKPLTSTSSIADVINEVASDTNAVSTVPDNKKPGDEAKKAKRRQYQAKKRQGAQKEQNSPPKKRMRKGSKPEEDYDSYMENVINQMKQLPAVTITEPELCRNYSVCPIFGSGDYAKLHHMGYDFRTGELGGELGSAYVSGEGDYYSCKPFGRESPVEPPPPPNLNRGFYNQEFATPRMQSSYQGADLLEDRPPTPFRDASTPDTIVSCSSPEISADVGDEYPGLKLISQVDADDRQYLRSSPVIPIFAPVPIRPSKGDQLRLLRDEMDKENINNAGTFHIRSKASSPLKEANSVTVTLTLTTAAAGEIQDVLTNLANVLAISAPSIVQVSDHAFDSTFDISTYQGKDGNEIVDVQGILNGRMKFCRSCDTLLFKNVIKKTVDDLPGFVPEILEDSHEVYFCNSKCLLKFTGERNIQLSPDELKSADSFDLRDNKRKLGHDSMRKGSEPSEKRWKGVRYRRWNSGLLNAPKNKRPGEKEVNEMLFRMKITVTPSTMPDDKRKCMFCHHYGDGVSDGPGRLLNYDVDKWLHLNCSLWSEEVYETESGALMNVDNALKHSSVLVCVACKQKGATVKCFKVRCSSVYHLGCAIKDGCTFYKDKTVFCTAHTPKGAKENELTNLSVYRRVYIQRDENRQVAAVMHHADQHHLLRVGSLIFLSVGQLLPHQLQNFHTANCIFPIGYKIVRFYWSMQRCNRRCQYICSIHEAEGKPEFRISPQEEGLKDAVYRAPTAQGAWHQVLDRIAALRNSSNIIKVFPKYITGEDLFGLTEPAIVRVLESLPGIETLTDYQFKYGRNPLLELPLAINPTGCARSEPKLRTHFKRPHTQRTGGTSTRPSSTVSSMSVFSSTSEAVCPYSKQFVHSKSSQYKKMKQEWRNNVYLARSKIQGLGLYAARDIEKHTMVIEYIGEIIRSELAEAREKRYESQNRGIYMFRVDDERVIDATLCGGLARYINHSCDPNCVAETVEVDRELRIIIFANRRISRGEELAYDYKFEVEDDQHKIHCFCGASNCKKWMN